MRYLFINVTAGFGSTGKIVEKQCRELIAQGHECLLAFGRKDNVCTDVPTLRIGNRLCLYAHVLQARLLDGAGFGSYAATKSFLRQVRRYAPDVIWLHNLHGYYIHVGLLFDYLRTCGKEIHWTLHDCWAFTGHCVHFDFVGCDRWKTGCRNCPQSDAYPLSLCDRSTRNYARKCAAFTGIPNMTLHVPSEWLKARAENSFLREYPVEVLPNTVDTTLFRPTPSDFRREYALENKKIVLGVANIWDDRKGLRDFAALSRLLPPACRIVLVGLNERQRAALPDSILGLPRTASAQRLAEIYTAADVYVSPSVEETFGMTVLEAACCGTPVIVYRGTACEETARPYRGIAVERGAENLARAIADLFCRKGED